MFPNQTEGHLGSTGKALRRNDMEIHVSRPDDLPSVAVLHIDGEITAATHEQVQAAAERELQSGARKLVLDLSKVPGVTSYGIRAISHIFGLLQSLSPSEGPETVLQGLRDGTFKSSSLKLVNPTPHVRKVLSMAGIDMFLEIYSTLDEAVRA